MLESTQGQLPTATPDTAPSTGSSVPPSIPDGKDISVTVHIDQPAPTPSSQSSESPTDEPLTNDISGTETIVPTPPPHLANTGFGELGMPVGITLLLLLIGVALQKSVRGRTD